MLRSVLAILCTRVLTRLVTMAAGILIARTIGVEEQGVLGLLLMLGGLLAGICDLGLGMGAVFFVGRQGWRADRFTGLALPVLALSTAAGLGLFAWLAATWLTDYAVALQGANLAALALFVGANTFTELYLNLTIARQRIAQYNLAELAFAAVIVVATLLLTARGLRNASVYLALYGAARLLVFLYLLSRQEDRPRPGPLRETATLLRYSLTQWSANLFSMLSVRVDALLLAWYIPRSDRVDLADLGLYTICLLTITRLMDVQRSIQTAFFSRVANEEASRAVETTNTTYRRSFLVYLVLSAALIAGGWPVLWLYGPEYPAAWGVLTVLVLGTITLRGNAGVLMLYFSSVDRSVYTVHTHQISLAGNLLLNILLIPRWGIMGAALGTALAFAAGKLYLLWRYQKETGSRWSRDLLLRPAEMRTALGDLRREVGAMWRGGGR
ncbi:MAG: polysaccharide biosynthesis C-terminal domain-containing protein [bacterium]|jgi:O-antigen/teichoic acid export membrane protein|nr:polysaccharide biosynthesis C-terminal domain-containing protein [bacterium]